MRNERCTAPNRYKRAHKLVPCANAGDPRPTLRQAVARFGHENLGFFWIFAEPLFLCSAVMIMWSLGDLHRGHGVGVVPFALTSYSLLTLWRHMCSHSVRALASSAPLLYHRNVRFLDILISRAALECLAGIAAFMVAYTVLNLLDVIADIDDPILMAGAWLLMTWFGWSFGLNLAALTELIEPASHLVQPILYVTLPLTGGFYMVLWLPQSAQDVVMWSPLVHIFEMFRGGMFGSHLSAEWSEIYVVIWCLAMTATGLPLLRLAQRRFTSG